MDRRVTLTTLAIAHLTSAAVHGVSHALLPVSLTDWGNLAVAATTFVGPVVGVALAWRGHRAGVPVFTLSMAGALLLGGTLHFLVATPDHVHAVPAGAWRLPFRVTAVALLVVDGVAVAVGTRYWLTRTDAAYSPAIRS